MSFELAELNRQFNNMVRIGTVHSVDYGQNRARVAFGAVVTDYLPWLTRRAAGNCTYDSLEVDEQVFVITPPGQALGVIIGVLNQSAFLAPENSSEIQKTVYKDGSEIMYNRSTHKLTAHINGEVSVFATENIQVETEATVRITAKRIELKGETVIDGSLSQGGGKNGGSASFNSSLYATKNITTASDVVAKVSLNGHTHGCREGKTGSPSS